ncbi:Phosphatidylcholine transfer protein [Eumeta japonica]|uniref:Phosphatidylcholine transfer protein n=1 Tax=Eumeta variegata TaxID=151549 RepID=A0A4C1V4E0_EUMVA|nr:Phosphatidylcholine transfer protein [Eumeta japonica]
MASTQKFRFILKDLKVRRLWGFWTRGFLLTSMVKKVKRENVVKEMIQCLRQTILRPRRTLFLAATAAYNASNDSNGSACDNSISDEDIEALKSDLDQVDVLAAKTLYCTRCGKRLSLDKRRPGIWYCMCGGAQHQVSESYCGWSPYIEAEDVIIWRREYKKGDSVYEYKVYGRYPDVSATDLAAIQVDGVYRRVWDTAVAALAVVETAANGVKDQVILHWEVLWPKLFANRDYVYIRRHKDYDVKNTPLPHKDALFLSVDTKAEKDNPNNGQVSKESSPGSDPELVEEIEGNKDEKEQVAVQPDIDDDSKFTPRLDTVLRDNKIYIIVSRACDHPRVPETSRAIRVTDYWSHMVVRSLNGVDKPGAEFVLTYFDAPSTGALPGGVVAWASGRAAPAYLGKMRKAAAEYKSYLSEHPNDEELPQFLPAEKLAFQSKDGAVNEEDMESSLSGPDLEGSEEESEEDKSRSDAEAVLEKKEESVTIDKRQVQCKSDERDDKNIVDQVSPSPREVGDEDQDNTSRWWRFVASGVPSLAIELSSCIVFYIGGPSMTL